MFRPGGAGPLRQRAGYAGGLLSMAVGLAASRSLATGQAVDASELGFPLGISGALLLVDVMAGTAWVAVPAIFGVWRISRRTR